MNDESSAVIDAFRALGRTATSGGIDAMAAELRRRIDADVAAFDLRGNVLSASPARSHWNYSAVRTAQGLPATSADAQAPDSSADLSVAEIRVGHDVVGLLAAKSANDPHGLVEFTSGLISTELARRQAGLMGRRELIGQVLEDVFHSRLADPDAAARLSRLGIDVAQPNRVLLGRVATSTDRLHSAPWNLYTLLSGTPEPYVQAVVRDAVVAILPDHPVIDRIAQSILRRLSALGNSPRVGVSAAHSGVVGLRAAYFEARSAAVVGPGIQAPKFFDLSRLILATVTELPLHELAERALSSLTEYDNLHAGHLVETLHVYLRFDRNAALAAQELYVHTNTLRYRLRQIADLTQLDLNDTTSIVNLWLAVNALRQDTDD